jgi:cell division protein FtsW
MALIRRRSDFMLAIAVVATVLFGVVMIYSASVVVGYTNFHDAQYFFKRQVVWALIGIITMIVMANIDYRFWKRWAGWMLGVTFVLLLSVFLFSKGEINGAHRWISFAGQTFQPSELAKLTFLIYLSAWLCDRKEEIASITKTFLPFVVIMAILTGLMLAEPDFGTLSVILASGISVFVVAGMTWQQCTLGIGTAAAGIGAIFLEPYRRARLETFLNPNDVTGPAAYQIKNIAIALGSGGWFGLGFGQSGQKRLFLPEPHTDSIFAIITEELGFIVAAIIIGVYVFIAYRGYRIALTCNDAFGRLLAVGITTWLVFQAFINLASMLRLVPLVGVPLPFISYGGTNLLISMAAVGILLNISRHASSAAEAPAAHTPARRTLKR